MTLYRFDGYAVDVILSAGFAAESEVTDFETDSGSEFTDHIQNKPIELTFDVVVSDSPIGEIKAERAGLAITASADAYETFRSIRDGRRPITIEAPLETYDRMAMTGLTIPQAVEDGEALRFEVVFKQITTVKVERSVVTLPRAKGTSRARGRATAGKATGQSAYLSNSEGDARAVHARNHVTGETGYYYNGNVYRPGGAYGYERVPDEQVGDWTPMDFDQSAHTWVDADTGKPVQNLPPVPIDAIPTFGGDTGEQTRPWWTGGGGS